MRLYKMELYKLIHKKIFLAGVVAVFGIMLLYFWCVEVGEEFAVVDGTTYTGLKAIQKNREIIEEFAGIITDKKINQIVEQYGIPSQLTDNMSGWRDGNYLNDFVVRYFTDGSWEQGVRPTELYTLGESELGIACSKYQKVPMLDYTNGWKVFVDMLNFSLMLGSVLVVCGVSIVFADEGTTKMLPLLFTTKEGKRRDIIAKILAAFSLTLLVFIGIVIIDFLLCKATFGFSGFDNMVAIVLSEHSREWMYMEDFSNYLMILLAMGIQGGISLCAITLCVSACSNSSFKAVVMASIAWVFPVLMRMLFRGMIPLIIYATPIFLVLNGMINDIYSYWQIILVISACIGVGCTIGGYKKYQMQNV